MQIIKLTKKEFLLKSADFSDFKIEESLQDSILKGYSKKDILNVIKRLGEESIAGFSNVSEDDVIPVLSMCEEYELADIWNALRKNRSPLQKV
jgi:hypothetical protein